MAKESFFDHGKVIETRENKYSWAYILSSLTTFAAAYDGVLTVYVYYTAPGGQGTHAAKLNCSKKKRGKIVSFLHSSQLCCFYNVQHWRAI